MSFIFYPQHTLFGSQTNGVEPDREIFNWSFRPMVNRLYDASFGQNRLLAFVSRGSMPANLVVFYFVQFHTLRMAILSSV